MACVDPSDSDTKHINTRVKELLDELSDLDPAARDAALFTLSETESGTVMLAVRRLLESHDRAGTFLGASAEPARSFGPYTLDRRLGEGGFGEVWAAEQSAPVRRRVAIKILKPGMDSRSILARFEAERQALAIMEHANIARVFDAGTTPEGRPYFVMEHVDGLPITTFCDQHRLTVTERLRLMLPVCRAVHHAHQKGVIHRDIKPGNVIVSIVDGAYIPKVIDFGIAKALDRSLTEQTLFTEHRAMIGTPEYMSPEQAEAGVVDIDTRADVYSLGVLMYELLAGATPFDPAELRRKAYGELQRIIREVDPPAPSQRAGQLPTAETIAERRRTEAGRLSRLVRGELDWIVMKCLEKDRAHRYDSASSLTTDLENYLAGRDVLAGPPSKIYRIGKMVRRNRTVVASVGARVDRGGGRADRHAGDAPRSAPTRGSRH
jgi:serine/threonine protein kinase